MAIEFVNINSGERVELERPHQIGAYLNSSDLGSNSNKGQDFGWRLAPAVMDRIEDMRSDPEALEAISKRTGVPIEEMTTMDLVKEISYQDGRVQAQKQARANRDPEFKKAYEAELAALRSKKAGTDTVEEEAPKPLPKAVKKRAQREE